MLSFLVPFAIVIAVLAVLYLVVFFGLKCGARALRLSPTLDKLAFSSGVVTVGVVVAAFYLTGNFADLQLNLGKVTEGNVVPFPTPAPVPQREASRLFAGPHQYPPSSFAAYGIVAFPSRATPDDRDRYIMLCEAYAAVLPHATEVNLPRSQQMVTVWPITTDDIADRVNRASREQVCGPAVDNYGLVIATEDLKDAAKAGKEGFDGRGPFLLAWSPSPHKGQPDALVLSDVTTPEEAKARLQSWKSDILEDPAIWDPSWNLQSVKIKMREWVDKYGPKALILLGAKGND
jgi:hypothetical protein